MVTNKVSLASFINLHHEFKWIPRLTKFLQGLDFEWCMAPDRGLVKPDLTFFIDANADTIKSRANYGEERYEKVEFQKKVAEAYGKFKA